MHVTYFSNEFLYPVDSVVYDECNIIPNIEGITVPTLPSPRYASGHTVVNNSLLWVSGGSYQSSLFGTSKTQGVGWNQD